MNISYRQYSFTGVKLSSTYYQFLYCTYCVIEYLLLVSCSCLLLGPFQARQPFHWLRPNDIL